MTEAMSSKSTQEDEVQRTSSCRNCGGHAAACGGSLDPVAEPHWQCCRCGQYYDLGMLPELKTCNLFLCDGCGLRTSDVLCACSCQPAASFPRVSDVTIASDASSLVPRVEAERSDGDQALTRSTTGSPLGVELPITNSLPGLAGEVILDALGRPVARVGPLAPAGPVLGQGMIVRDVMGRPLGTVNALGGVNLLEAEEHHHPYEGFETPCDLLEPMDPFGDC